MNVEDFNRIREVLKEKLSYWGQEIADEDVMDLPEFDLRDEINESDEFKLYRYIPVDYFNVRNIETQVIHLSSNGVMNDIYDGLPAFISGMSYSKLQNLRDLSYMTCMTECCDNILMWSHYAHQHEGICIEYDLKRNIVDKFGIKKHLFPVIYESKRYIERDIESLIRSHNDLNEAIRKNNVYDGEEELDDILPLFLMKGDMWSYEREWRIIFTKKQMYTINEEELYSGNLDFPCISAVYLGYRIHPEVKRHVKEICKRISKNENIVKVYQATLDGECYKLNFELE